MNPRKILLRFLIILVYGIAFSSVSYLLSLLISRALVLKQNIFDIMSAIGILIIVLGAFSLVDGNPSGTGLNTGGPIGSLGSQYSSNINMQVTAEERKLTGHFKNFKKNGVVSFKRWSIYTICGGIFTLIVSMILV